MKRSKDFKSWGQIRLINRIQWTLYAFEATYGYNGWHPHIHELFLVNWGITDEQIEDLKSQLTAAWLKACRQAKIEIPNEIAFMERSVDVSRAKSPADYIAKFGLMEFEANREKLAAGWGASQELAKSHVKSGRSEHFTPFDLARKIKEHEGNYAVYNYFGKILRQYQQAMHGKNQIRFERGLKRYFDIGSMTDDEIAAMK